MRRPILIIGILLLVINMPAYAEQTRNVELLAASCAACHGTRGHSVGGTLRLAGLDKLHFLKQMGKFVTGERYSIVMQHHASGYSAEEVELLADFFSKQNPE